ncbi:glucose-6-phosphate isomerase [Thalassotalea ganghwensis]
MNLLKLQKIFDSAKNRNITELFAEDETTKVSRAARFSIEAGELLLDYSKQNITEQELNTLIQWAYESGLSEQVTDMFTGKKINTTENRAVLHTLLRTSDLTKDSKLDEQIQQIVETEHSIKKIVNSTHSREKLSTSGKPFTDVLVIGIGGSYYGTKVALSALCSPQKKPKLNVHVLASVDSEAMLEKLTLLPPETTMVVVVSKTFTTQETMLNAKAVKAWMVKSLGSEDVVKHQWFAVTSVIEKALQFGLSSTHVLPMWDWVGGRFSAWSAVGIPIALAFGYEVFTEFRNGAKAMDEHFLDSDFHQNMPIIMALLGIWNRNILGYPSLAILPYSHKLRALPGYLQQIDMESNGKAVDFDGKAVLWDTAPTVFGQEGTNSQHAFMQLMHQAKDIIPTDFIVSLTVDNQYREHHSTLVANCFAQSEALMRGKSLEQVKLELLSNGMKEAEAMNLAPHKIMKGNTPSNTILLNQLTAFNLGALLALYEHKVAVQGFLWQINSFDQWGVELGKQLSHEIIESINGQEFKQFSSSTHMLIEKYKSLNFKT